MVDLSFALQSRTFPRPVFGFPSISSIPKDEAICDCSDCIDGSYTLQRARRTKLLLDEKVRLERLNEIDITKDNAIARTKRLLKESVMILPGVIPAYALRNRRWVLLDVEFIEDMKFEDNSFADLVLPQGHKELVLSLVQNHVFAPEDKRPQHVKEVGKDRTDLVLGKGRGRIILLHGAPGVGKTSTAECVADYTCRPLFPVTCGDIGHDSKEVEDNLTNCFKLAHRWDCVMLLDEADIFMARRAKEDLKRNGLVSVFLRILEYYSGVLFLTTNRIGVFDEGFKSRIHLSLFYPALDAASTKNIWETNIRRARENKPSYDIQDVRIMEFATKNFARLKWNGRQIRNAFQTAISLAEYDAKRPDVINKTPTVTAEHFVKVATASLEFDHYLTKTYKGVDESTLAFKDGIRWDLKDDKGDKANNKPEMELYVPAPSSPEDLDDPEWDEAGLTESQRKVLRKKKLVAH